MILVKVSYDAYNQDFRLVDPKFAGMFDDGETYLLAMEFLPADDERGEPFVDYIQTGIANA